MFGRQGKSNPSPCHIESLTAPELHNCHGVDTLNIELAKKFFDEWVSDWNSHDIDRIISHYSENLEFKSPLIVERYSEPSGTIFTRKKLREYFLIGLTNNPSLKFTLKQVLLGVNGITLYYENARGGNTAEYFEFNDENKVIRSVSCYS